MNRGGQCFSSGFLYDEISGSQFTASVQAALYISSPRLEPLLLATGNGIFAGGDRRPETAPETLSACRDRKAVRKNRKNWPANAAFLLAGSTVRVSEDCLVADAVCRNRSPRPNSLLTGKLTGNFEKLRLGPPVSAAKALT